MARIHVLNGADVGRSFEVAPGATLGRDASCDVALRDASVSRKHARLELTAGSWRVVDTGSRNGLRVAGERVSEAPLEDLAEFTIGDVAMRFRADSNAPGASAPGAGSSAPAADPRPARAPAPAADDDEIVLEGDWSAPVAEPVAPVAPLVPRPPQAAPVPRPATPAPAGAAGAPTASRTGAFAPANPARTAPPLAATAARARPQAAVVSAGRGVLQYHKVEARAGLFNADLAQMPLWIKLVVGVLALAVFAGLFWAAFHGAAFLKGKAQGAPEVPEVIDGESGEAR